MGFCPGHLGRVSSILDLYSLDARSMLPPYYDDQRCPQILPDVPWGRKPPSVEKLLFRKMVPTVVGWKEVAWKEVRHVGPGAGRPPRRLQ